MNTVSARKRKTTDNVVEPSACEPAHVPPASHARIFESHGPAVTDSSAQPNAHTRSNLELLVSPPFLAATRWLTFPPLRAFLQTRKAQLFWVFPKWALRRNTHACMYTRTNTGQRSQTGKKAPPPPRAKTLSPETQRCKDCFGFNAALFSQLEVSRRRVRFSARSHILWIPQSPLPKTKATFQKDWGRRGREKHACSEDEPLTVGTRTRAEPT